MAPLQSATRAVWRDSQETPLAPLLGNVEADVCVIGLGHSGLSAIQAALELGQTVVGLDAIGVGAGAAGQNGGFLLAGLPAFYHNAQSSHGREVALAWYRATLDTLDAVAAATPGVSRQGSLRIASSAVELEDCAAQYDCMRQDAQSVDRYDGPEGRGLLFPEDGACNPLLRCQHLARQVVGSGARLYGNAKAVEVAANIVTTETARVTAKHVLITIDGKLETLCPELGTSVRTARLQMLSTSPLSTARFPRPVYARYGYEYIHQLSDRCLALGGFRDRGGAAEWTTEECPTDAVQHALELYLRETLHVHEPIRHRWGASVGYSTSGLPITGMLASGVWVTGGYSGTGNLIGTICGRALARRAVGRDSLLDHLAVQSPSEVLPPSSQEHESGEEGVGNGMGDHQVPE